MFIFIPCIKWWLPPGEFVLDFGKKLAWKLFPKVLDNWAFPVLHVETLSSAIAVLFNFICRESYIAVLRHLKNTFWISFLACNLEKVVVLLNPHQPFLLSFFSLCLLKIDFRRDSSKFSSFYSISMFLDFLFSSPQKIVVSF